MVDVRFQSSPNTDTDDSASGSGSSRELCVLCRTRAEQLRQPVRAVSVWCRLHAIASCSDNAMHHRRSTRRACSVQKILACLPHAGSRRVEAVHFRLGTTHWIIHGAGQLDVLSLSLYSLSHAEASGRPFRVISGANPSLSFSVAFLALRERSVHHV